MKDSKGLLDALLATRSTLPELQDLVHALMEEFGGFRKFAKEWGEHYKNSKNAMTKQKMLSEMVKLIILANNQQVDNPVEGMSDDELRAVLKEVVEQTPTTPEKTP